ncbi:MAG TPA: hypothetical protein VFW73_07425 [Lacipirellulaceae bacterium]|nr:hypothetical protein [Lacipirellulaceae bacterium]
MKFYKYSLATAAFISCLCALASAAVGFDLTNGRRIILQRGLQIQSLAFVSSTPAPPTDFSLWKSANFTTFNSWNDKNSEKILGWTMPWSRWIKTDGSNPLSNNETNQHLDELVSLQYGDELNQDPTGTLDAATLNTLADTFADWHSQYGANFLAYTNFGANNASKSMTPAALANYMQATNPDMLMFDAYPRQYITMSTWYAEMQKYRLAGLAGIDRTGQSPIPYAQYLDLYRTSYTASQPSESFIRLQEFGSWAFGYTFVTAFVYNKPNNDTVYPTMFSGDGDSQPTDVFAQVAETSRQSLNLGPALVRLTSTDLRMIPGTSSSLPAGISAWAPGAGGDSYITSITPVTSPGGSPSRSHADVIIGHFEPLLADNGAFPFAGGTHFMLVNGSSTDTADQSAQWYHLTFDFGDSSFDSLQMLSRNTGQVELVPLTHLTGSQYSLDWNLPGGTGDLFRFWNDAESFPMAGDFNADGAVDAADYLLWRKGLGTSYSPNDYELWQSHFGESDTAGSSAAFASSADHFDRTGANVPEPRSLALIVLAIAATCCCLRLNPAAP